MHSSGSRLVADSHSPRLVPEEENESDSVASLLVGDATKNTPILVSW